MTDYLTLFFVVMGVNLLPAFGPPTWTVLMVFVLNSDMATLPAVLTAAAAAALGRYSLAAAFRAMNSRLSLRTRQNLAAASALLSRSRRRIIAALALFAISPLPSAQLFEAAGLIRVRLLPFTAAFFAGRLVSYFVYTSTAVRIRETNVGEAFRNAFSQPLGIAFQVGAILLLAAGVRVKWGRWLSNENRPARP